MAKNRNYATTFSESLPSRMKKKLPNSSCADTRLQTERRTGKTFDKFVLRTIIYHLPETVQQFSSYEMMQHNNSFCITISIG